MPRIDLMPLIKLSKEQYKVWIDRAMAKEGKLTQRLAGALMNRPFEPPVTQEVGSLFKDVPGENLRQVERLPIEQARAKYAANPDEYVTPGMTGPSAKVMRTVEPGSPEELAGGLAYERIKESPIIPPPAGRTTSVMKRELKDQVLRQKLKNIGINPDEDIRPGVKLETVLEEQGIKTAHLEEVPPAAMLSDWGNKADEAWRAAGGARSGMARVWEMYRTSSRQSSHIHDARDYFISSFVRWKQDPGKFAKAYPREARVLNELQDQGLFAASTRKPKLRGEPPFGSQGATGNMPSEMGGD